MIKPFPGSRTYPGRKAFLRHEPAFSAFLETRIPKPGSQPRHLARDPAPQTLGTLPEGPERERTAPPNTGAEFRPVPRPEQEQRKRDILLKVFGRP